MNGNRALVTEENDHFGKQHCRIQRLKSSAEYRLHIGGGLSLFSNFDTAFDVLVGHVGRDFIDQAVGHRSAGSGVTFV